MKFILSSILLLNTLASFSLKAMDPPAEQDKKARPESSVRKKLRGIFSDEKTLSLLIKYSQKCLFDENIKFLALYFNHPEKLEKDYKIYLSLNKVSAIKQANDSTESDDSVTSNVIYQLLLLADVKPKFIIEPRLLKDFTFEMANQAILIECSNTIKINIHHKDRDILQKIIDERQPFKQFDEHLNAIVETICHDVNPRLTPGWEDNYIVPLVDKNIVPSANKNIVQDDSVGKSCCGF